MEATKISIVMPVTTGIQVLLRSNKKHLDTGFRRYDDNVVFFSKSAMRRVLAKLYFRHRRNNFLAHYFDRFEIIVAW